MAEAASAPVAEHHSNTGIDSRKFLMWMFLGSECLLFGSLISVYLIFKGEPTTAVMHNGLPMIPENILDIPLTSQSTFVLLMSSVTMVLAVYGAQHGNKGMMRLWLIGTIVLGSIFLGYQVMEFTTFGHEGLNLGTNNFGASFFLLTGTHGTHVAVGVLYLSALLLSSFRRNGLGSETGLHIETAGLYWHFMDVAWIVIFTVVYLIPA